MVSCDYLRLAEKLLPSIGMQAPMRKPSATAPAKTSPQGRSIDFQIANLTLTKLAFWTEIKAIPAIQIAAIAEIVKLTIDIQRIKVFKRSENRLT